MMRKYVTVELGGNPRVWANLRGSGCALMTRTDRQGVYVLGNDATETLIQSIEGLVASLEGWESGKLETESTEPAYVLGLSNPLRTLSWYPEATSEKYAVLEWGSGHDGSDGFLQLVEREHLIQWPGLLRSGMEEIGVTPVPEAEQ